MYTLIGTAKLNDVDPQAWLADALHRRPCRQSRTCYGHGVAAEEQPSPSDQSARAGSRAFPWAGAHQSYEGQNRRAVVRDNIGGRAV